MRAIAIATVLLVLLGGAAKAETTAELLTRHLYAGTLAEGDKALGAAAAGGDAEAMAGQGMVRFVMAIEHLAQGMHRHGLATRSGGPMMNLPVLRIPVPPNTNPEPLDYAKFRAIFQRLVDDLDAAEQALAGVGDKPVKFPIDLLKVRLDLDGDGKASEYEVLGGLMNNLAPGMAPPQVSIAFDTADMYWLRGYSRFIGAFAQFMLAHDFQGTFDKTFHVFFPNAALPLADKLRRSEVPGGGFIDGAAGDAVAFIHLINWPVAEPARLADVRVRLKAMAEMSRKTWSAARAETDDEAEWLPNGKQKNALGGTIEDGIVDGWLAVMSEFEAILDGKKLMPHWRFMQGLNVKRMFEESKNFDLVLLIAGADAVPWLEDGLVSSSADWDRLMAVFQGNFLGYAMWFN